jgi:hypothetical protein
MAGRRQGKYGTPNPSPKKKEKKKKKTVSPQRHLAVKYGTSCKNSLFLPENEEIFFAYSSVGYKPQSSELPSVLVSTKNMNHFIVSFKDEIGNK